MRTISQIAAFAAVLGFLACGQVGCASAKNVGDEKSGMFSGTQTIVYGDPVTVTNAAKAVAADLELTVVSSTSSGLDGKTVAKTANNTKLTVDVKTAGEGYSRLTVRAGGFSGDKTMQKQVLDRIRQKLPADPNPQPAPVAKTSGKGSTAKGSSAPSQNKATAAAPSNKTPAATQAPQTQEQEPTNTAHLPF